MTNELDLVKKDCGIPLWLQGMQNILNVWQSKDSPQEDLRKMILGDWDKEYDNHAIRT